MNKIQKSAIGILSCLMLGTSTQVQSAVIFSDSDVILVGQPGANTFGLTQPTGGAVGGNLTAPGGDPTLTITTNSVGSSQGYFLSYFTAQSLVSLGQKITFSFTASLSAIPAAAQSTPFRVGLFNSNGTKIAANSFSSVSNTVFADDTGYSAYYRTASGSGSGSLTELATGTVGVARSEFPGTATSIPTSPTTPALGLTANNPFSGTFSLELTASGILVTSSITVGATTYTSSVTDTTGYYTTFDTLGLYSQSLTATPTTMTVTSISVAMVPEPGAATLALFGGGLVVLRLRHRSRKG